MNFVKFLRTPPDDMLLDWVKFFFHFYIPYYLLLLTCIYTIKIKSSSRIHSPNFLTKFPITACRILFSRVAHITKICFSKNLSQSSGCGIWKVWKISWMKTFLATKIKIFNRLKIHNSIKIFLTQQGSSLRTFRRR